MTSPGNDGFLLVDKPPGLSSHDVVAKVRRARGKIRAGHTGTLDPFATGLLVVALGRATRLIRFVPSEPKGYDATIRFGRSTDTDDATGNVVEQGPLPDEKSIRAGIAKLTGIIQQVPPSYSAKHVDGRRAYALARRGAEVVLAPVSVEVHAWQVHGIRDGELRAGISCGPGTYIRALARDLGRLCGTVAHLGELRRTTIGPFDVRDAVAPEDAAGAVLASPAHVLAWMKAELVSPDDVQYLTHGRPIERPPHQYEHTAAGAGGGQSGTSMIRLLDETGSLVAVAERDGDWLQPRVVMRDA